MVLCEQLTLPVDLPDDQTFASFCVGENRQLFEHLSQLSQGVQQVQLTFIVGDGGAGKSHLLYACCHQAEVNSLPSIYLDLSRKQELSPQLFDGLESFALICLDNIEAIAGDRAWEVALFNLINRVKQQQQGEILITARHSPTLLNLSLPDLASRLTWGVSYSLLPLGDQHKVQLLMQRANMRGISMPLEVSQYMCRHLSRDMHSLMHSLQHLSASSLQVQRKLTIPFVKQVFDLS